MKQIIWAIFALCVSAACIYFGKPILAGLSFFIASWIAYDLIKENKKAKKIK